MGPLEIPVFVHQSLGLPFEAVGSRGTSMMKFYLTSNDGTTEFSAIKSMKGFVSIV